MLWVAAVLVVLAYGSGVSAELALEFEKCHYGDVACFKNVGNLLLKNYGKTGVRSMNLLPFDPLHVNSIKLSPDPKSAVSVAFSFNNVDIFGLSGLQDVSVSGFTRDVKDRIVMKGKLPALRLTGPYSLAGSVLGLRITGKGVGDIALKNVELTAAVGAQLVKKGSDEFLDIKDVTFDISTPQQVTFYFSDLFDGNKELSDSTHTFLNQNWREIFGEIRPGLTKAYGLIFKGILKAIFDKHPYTDFFLE